MGENEMKVRDIPPPSSPEKEVTPNVIVISSSSSSSSDDDDDDEVSPLRPIFCLKKNMDMKVFEETEDCFILDFDPFESLDLSKLSVSKNHDHDDHDVDLTVVAEKGQVACRDYPHSRHLCVKFPFENTPHESYCNMCYCYVCDLAAPCENWIKPQHGHCHATEHTDNWKLLRESRKQLQPPFKDERLKSS